jgi:hypothetical protein
MTFLHVAAGSSGALSGMADVVAISHALSKAGMIGWKDQPFRSIERKAWMILGERELANSMIDSSAVMPQAFRIG